jgi:hypothetical protein
LQTLVGALVGIFLKEIYGKASMKNFDPLKTSRAVIANIGKEEGIVIWYVGYSIQKEIEEYIGSVMTSYLNFKSLPKGISIWEGAFKIHYDLDGGTDGSTPEGRFRAPTQEEWTLIHQGKAPWDENDFTPD